MLGFKIKKLKNGTCTNTKRNSHHTENTEPENHKFVFQSSPKQKLVNKSTKSIHPLNPQNPHHQSSSNCPAWNCRPLCRPMPAHIPNGTIPSPGMASTGGGRGVLNHRRGACVHACEMAARICIAGRTSDAEIRMLQAISKPVGKPVKNWVVY